MQRDHLQRDRPRFRKALELLGRDRDRAARLGRKHRRLLQRFRDCGDGVRALHPDGRTSLDPSHGMHLDTATPTHLRWGVVIED